jgi:hypothetical protein
LLWIVKVRPDGREAARYRGRELPAEPGWLAVRAEWTHGFYDLGYLTFQDGDYLDEYFSLDQYFNAFAIFRAGGEFAGWYCNVTYPTRVLPGEIQWHDLYVDVIVQPNGETVVVDEDELEASGLETRDPKLYDAVLASRDHLLTLVNTRAYPFCLVPFEA